jgi:putative Mn2+ efflux pump MntP
MGFWELLIIAVGLAMDAFAVSIGKGLSVRKIEPRHTMSVGLWFGGFQALMPIVGYLLGISFASLVKNIDHWIAFILLAIIGFNMVREALHGDDECEAKPDFSIREMLTLAVATSIDALAIGITFALLPDVNIIAAVLFIGIITFAFSSTGVKIGNIFGMKYKSKAEFLGGSILVLLGAKILLEHLHILNLG